MRPACTRHAARGLMPTPTTPRVSRSRSPDYDDFARFPGQPRRRDRGAGRACSRRDLWRTRAARHRGNDGGLDGARSQRGARRDRRLRHPVDPAATRWTSRSRYKSTSRIVEVNGNIADGGNLHTLNNPSAVGGRGGSCFGDSGGPLFVNNTNQVVAVVSFGFSSTCHGADYSWRVDTQPSYDFILAFLD